MTETIEATVPIKCVLLGETAVGKTSLINRFVNDVFQDNFVPTMVGCYSSKDIFYDKANRKIKYEIWDTAGQEKYRSINKIFYQDAYINILVYDITKKNTFKALKDYWIEEIKENGPRDAIIIIAENKSDLYEHEAVDEDEVRKYCKNIDAIYQLTSAQTGEGVNELFNKIGKELLIPRNLEQFKKFNEKKKEFDNSKNAVYAINNTNNNNNRRKKGCC